MPCRIEVQSAILDARGKVKKKQFEALGLKHKIGGVYVLDCYTIDAKLKQTQIQKATELLVNPLVEKARIIIDSSHHPHLASPIKGEEKKKFPSLDGRGKGRVIFDYAIEISFLPGVTDNVGNTAKETLEDGLRVKFKPGQNVYSSQVFLISFAGKQKNNSPSSSLSLRAEGQPPLNIRGGEGGDIKKIADSLYNPLIQRASVKTFNEYLTPPQPSPSRGGKKRKFLPLDGGGQEGVGFGFNLPKVKLTSSQKVVTIDLNVPNKELVEIGKLGILDPKGFRRGPLSLSLDYLKTIRTYFNKLGRNPTDVELESLAQTWSEHCKHTIFASPIDKIKHGIFRHYIKSATAQIMKSKNRKNFCASVFNDNSGAIVFDKNYLVTHKVETHNTPSALDPFGGAITGIVGVNRDTLGFGLGAKPVINVYGFCFAPPDDETILYRDAAKLNKMLSAKRIMEGVVAGVNAGGNQSGIPTNSGFLHFDSRYRGKPLVFCGTVGLIPKTLDGRLSYIKQAQDGDYIVMVGGKVGLDGIHGATFSSESLSKSSPATAVQIGDPITQKKFSDAIVKEARSLNLYSSITDCGAGGLSSAVGEMAKESSGCEVWLDKVPVKYPGLAPWQIWISESQERMTLAVPPKKWKVFEKLMKQRDVETAVIGRFTNSGRCVVKFKKQTVMDIDLNFLHEGLPKKQLFTSPPHEGELVGVIENSKNNQSLLRPPLTPPHEEGDNFNSQILSLLSRPNLASFEFISQQYDHEVQGGSVLKPLEGRGRVNSEATITKPILDSSKGVALSSALFPSYSEIDPYKMAACAIDTAIRNAVAAGANVNYLALLDNFCWCSSNDPKRLWQLKQAAKACFDYSVAFGTPFISGKDSMFNDFQGFNENGKPIKISIPPTLLISAIGVIPDVTKTVSLDAKMPGDLIYILGETHDELGGSEYFNMVSDDVIPAKAGIQKTKTWIPDQVRNDKIDKVPRVNAETNYQLYKTFFQAVQKDLVASAISVGRGGSAITLLKMVMAGDLGAQIDLQNLPGKWKENFEALFSESMGRILVMVNPKKALKFERQMQGNVFACIGKVTNQKQLGIKDKNNKAIVNIKIASALKAYKSTFKDY